MHSNNLLLAAGAATIAVASAHGAGHGHGHAQFHNKRDGDVAWVYETVTQYVTVTEGETSTGGIFAQVSTSSTSTTTTSSSSSSSTSTSTSTSSTPTTTSTSSAKAAATSSSSVSVGVSGSVSVYTDFSCSSSKRATAAEIAYQGYTGTPYGCNMMLVDSSIADSYQYSIDFENVASEPYQIICWNKYGNDYLLDGWYEGKGQPITFTLAAGSTQAVAFYPNSLGACAVGAGSVPVVTASGSNPNGGSYETGAYAGTWVEFGFGDGNSGGTWTGYDASSLLAQRNSMTVYGLQVCSSDCSNTCSSINPGGATYSNAYVSGLEDADGIGGNCPEDKIKITAQVGWSG